MIVYIIEKWDYEDTYINSVWSDWKKAFKEKQRLQDEANKSKDGKHIIYHLQECEVQE